MAGIDGQEESGSIEAFSGGGGAAFELQLRLDAGSQVLNDRALRRVISGGMPALPRKLERSQSALQESVVRTSISGPKLGRSLSGKIPRPRNDLKIGSDGRHAGTELVFGTDMQAPAEARVGMACSICLTDSDLLQNSAGPAGRFCGNQECTSAFCKPCFIQYVTGKVTDALHFAPPILCPGCRNRVHTDAWINLVEDAVRVRYNANAASLLSIRCPECDGVSSLLSEFDAEATESAKCNPADSLPGLDATHRAKASMAFLAFSKGKISADRMLEVLISGWHSDRVGRLPIEANKLLARAFRLIKDGERRVSLQLACLRRFPKIRTPCCNRKMCFKCKVDGWHIHISCEQRQQRFVSTESGVQSCPDCGVPTQRTEGCLQVQCVCGRSWQWEDEAGDDAGHGRVPLLLGALAAPVDGGVSNTNDLVRTLIEFRASLDAVDSSDGTGSVHFASMPVPDSKRSAIPRCNDSSRLEVLLQLKNEGFPVDFNLVVVDNDGDEITPLSVAISHGNMVAAAFLMKHGATLQQSVVRELNHAVLDLRPIVATMQPLFDRHEDRPIEMDTLLLWLSLGKYEQAEAILSNVLASFTDGLVEEKLIDLAFALLKGQWAVADECASVEKIQNIERSLQKFVEGADKWDCITQKAATKMLLSTVHGMKFQRPDANVLSLARAAIAARADPDAKNEDDTSVLTVAIEYENAEFFELLLTAGATVDLDEMNGTLGESMQKAKQFSPAASTATAITKALAANVSQSTVLEPPLWLCVQLGLVQQTMKMLGMATSDGHAKPKSRRHAKQQKEQHKLDGHVAIAFLRAVLMGLIDDSTAQAAEGLFKSRVGSDVWKTWRQESATALMLLEFRQAFNAERNPDLAMLRKLLADFGADANGVPRHLDDELAEHALSHGDEGDAYRTPLMQLCTNTYCSPENISSIIALLKEFGADVERHDEDGDACLCFAFINHNITASEILLTNGAQLQLSSLDSLQNWVHPSHLRQLAPVLTVRSRHNDVDSIPGWLRIQFGLWEERDADTLGALIVQSNEEAEADELVRAWLCGRLSNCGGGQQFVEDVMCNTLGRERYTELKLAAANDLLQSELEGALNGHWEVDVELVRLLLEMGASPNTLVTFNNDDEDDDDDDDDAEEEEEEDGSDSGNDSANNTDNGSDDDGESALSEGESYSE